jgi:hypothetical protein
MQEIPKPVKEIKTKRPNNPSLPIGNNDSKNATMIKTITGTDLLFIMSPDQIRMSV